MVYSLHLFQSHPRKQLIHSYFRLKEMAKLGLDVKAAMPQAEEVEDEGTLGNAQALLNNKWFSNAKNVIVRVGNYERHKQNVRAYNMALLANMFSNFAKSRSAEVAAVRTQSQALELVSEMFAAFGIQWFWNPEAVDPLAQHECHLLKYSRDKIIRLVLDLGMEMCERENDALGLRGLRIALIPYFRNKTKAATSKYGRYLITDLVVEKSASPRSSPVRYVLKIHFFIEFGLKMIQFKIQFKTKSKLFIQKNIHSIESRIFNRIIHS